MTIRPTALIATAALAASLGFVSSGLVGAEAGAPPPLSKSQVKKIAKKVADKEIVAKAPTLSVKSAKTADFATNATTAQTAVNAGTVGGFNINKFNVVVANNAAVTPLITVGGMTLNASCTALAPVVTASAAGGKLRSSATNGNNEVFTNGTNNLTVGGVTVSNTAVAGIGSISLTYVSPSGQNVSAWVGIRNDATPSGCSFFGNAVVG